MYKYVPLSHLGCLRFSIVRGNRTITEAILSLVVEKNNREPTVYKIGVGPRKTMFSCLLRISLLLTSLSSAVFIR